MIEKRPVEWKPPFWRKFKATYNSTTPPVVIKFMEDLHLRRLRFLPRLPSIEGTRVAASRFGPLLLLGVAGSYWYNLCYEQEQAKLIEKREKRRKEEIGEDLDPVVAIR